MCMAIQSLYYNRVLRCAAPMHHSTMQKLSTMVIHACSYLNLFLPSMHGCTQHTPWMVCKCQLGYPNSGGGTHDQEAVVQWTSCIERSSFFQHSKDSIQRLLCTASPNTDQPDPCILELKPWTKAACMHANTEYKDKGVDSKKHKWQLSLF